MVSDLREVGEVITRIAKEKNVRLAVKSKVPFEDEMNLADVLAKFGIRLIDLGSGDEGSPADIVAKADMGISGADLAVAETGSIAIATRRDEDRLVTCLPPVHVAVVPSSVLVRDLDDALPFLERTLQDPEPCVVSFVSGPSRTRDIEIRLVLGVHGPHELHAVMLTDR